MGKRHRQAMSFSYHLMIMKFRLFTASVLSLMFFCAEIPAQGVYVTRDKNGPVFSDKPQAGSTELKLAPLTVIPAQPTSGTNKTESPSRASNRPEARPPERERPEILAPYRSLSVLAPVDGGSVGDTSFLELRLAIDPPLLRAEGHAFIVHIDDRPVDQRFTSTEFVIPPSFWPDGYLPLNQRMQLDVAVVDGGGQVLMRAPSVHFRSLPVILQPPLYPTRPGYHPQPPKKARPAPPSKTPKAQLKKN
jgi:hypothetical protein